MHSLESRTGGSERASQSDTCSLATDAAWTSRATEFRARALLCPDMAFALGPLHGRSPLLDLCSGSCERTRRREREVPPKSTDRAVDWLDEPPMWLRALSYRLMGAARRSRLRRFARPLLMRIYAPLARQRLRRGLEMLASAEVVITDRIHGHILCLLLGIPHVLLDNNYGKLSSFYQTWTAEVDSVRWADSPAEALAGGRAGSPRETRRRSEERRVHNDGVGRAHHVPDRELQHGPYIGDCLSSLRGQTDPNWLGLDRG